MNLKRIARQLKKLIKIKMLHQGQTATTTAVEKTLGPRVNGNSSHRSKTNLDDYINFFDSSVVLAPTSSDA